MVNANYRISWHKIESAFCNITIWNCLFFRKGTSQVATWQYYGWPIQWYGTTLLKSGWAVRESWFALHFACSIHWTIPQFAQWREESWILRLETPVIWRWSLRRISHQTLSLTLERSVQYRFSWTRDRKYVHLNLHICTQDQDNLRDVGTCHFSLGLFIFI